MHCLAYVQLVPNCQEKMKGREHCSVLLGCGYQLSQEASRPGVSVEYQSFIKLQRMLTIPQNPLAHFGIDGGIISCIGMFVVHSYNRTCIARVMLSQLVVLSDEEPPCGYAVYHQFEIMQHVVILVCNALQRTSRRRYETHRSVSRLPLS